MFGLLCWFCKPSSANCLGEIVSFPSKVRFVWLVFYQPQRRTVWEQRCPATRSLPTTGSQNRRYHRSIRKRSNDEAAHSVMLFLFRFGFPLLLGVGVTKAMKTICLLYRLGLRIFYLVSSPLFLSGHCLLFCCR